MYVRALPGLPGGPGGTPARMLVRWSLSHVHWRAPRWVTVLQCVHPSNLRRDLDVNLAVCVSA